MTGKLNLAVQSALAIALLSACSPEPQPQSKLESGKAPRTHAVASRSAEWIRSRTVYGVHLGMDADEAIKVLAKYGSVWEQAPNHSSDDQAWRRTYSISKLRPARLPLADLVVAGADADGRPRSSYVELWTTVVGKRRVVTGISYGFHGSVDRDLKIGAPTDEFVWVTNGDSQPALFFGSQRDQADQTILRGADNCNAPTEASHWGPGYSPRCDPNTFPSKPYILVVSYNTGLVSVELRDGEAGREHLLTMEQPK